MKPYIVTIQDGSNAGAHLQAFALRRVMNRFCGETPRFVATGVGNIDMRLIDRYMRLQTKNALKRFDYKAFMFALRKDVLYRRIVKNDVDVVAIQEVCPGDLVVFGSDEIWNVNRRIIREHPCLWGSGLEDTKRVAYAASANGADMVGSVLSQKLSILLSGFDALSVRDKYTAEQVTELTGRQPTIVCDPVLLMEVDEWRGFQHLDDRKPTKPYMLVYSYGNSLSDKTISELRSFAHKQGLNLISADFWLPWCDECIPCGPFGLLQLIDEATCVVSDTFHGTLTSVVYRKNFVSYAGNKSKIADLLKRLGLEDRNPDNGKSIEECMNFPAYSNSFEKRLSDFRFESLSYLRTAVEMDGWYGSEG